jgi:uncharacterized membrane protein YkvA (DUF1232 family)
MLRTLYRGDKIVQNSVSYEAYLIPYFSFDYAVDTLRMLFYSPTHSRDHMFREISLIWEIPVIIDLIVRSRGHYVRLAFPILMMLMPRFLPQIIKHVVLVWRLIFDKRVNLLLRSLVPLAVIYAIVPTDLVKDQIPVIGRFDDFIVFGLAVLFLIKLAPKHIVDEYLGVKPASNRPEDRDPKNVVDGSSRLIDD